MNDKQMLDEEITISANVISMSDFSLQRKPKKPFDSCKHIHMTMDDENHTVECIDCSQPISNYVALKMFIGKWDRLQSRIDRQKTMVSESLEKTLVLRSAQIVEKAWRSKSMVPACPHCHEPIFPTDGFCGHMINKRVALSRRAAAEIGRAL